MCIWITCGIFKNADSYSAGLGLGPGLCISDANAAEYAQTTFWVARTRMISKVFKTQIIFLLNQRLLMKDFLHNTLKYTKCKFYISSPIPPSLSLSASVFSI